MDKNHDCKPVSVTTYDGISLEKVCLDCGQVFPTDESPIDKLDRCFDLQAFMNVRYGPATAQGLQSFLLPMPTDKRLKVSDKFIDTSILSRLRAFTDLLRLCESVGVPKYYAEEAMRILVKKNRGLFSENKQIHTLMHVLSIEPRLWSKIDELEQMIAPRKPIEKHNPFDRMILERAV